MSSTRSKLRLTRLRPILILLVCFGLSTEPNSARILSFGASVQAAPTAQLAPAVTTITVNTTADPDSDDDKLTCNYTSGAFFFPGDETGQTCSFRWAWNEAIARPQADRPIAIEFNIPTSDPNYEVNATGTWVIQTDEALPGLNPDNGANGTSLNGQIYIDGDTQPGGRTDAPKIIINTNDFSWEIESEGNLFTNLSFRGGGVVFLKEANNMVDKIWMGLTDDGMGISFRTPSSPERMAGGGVFITSDNNTVQNSTISGAFAKAVDIGATYSGNIIQNNNIGTFADGTVPEIPQNVQCIGAFSQFSDQHYGGWGISIAGSNNQVLENRLVGMHNIRSANDTAPMALEIFGDGHIIRENIIGRDSAGNDLGVCGQGIKVSDTNTRIVGNTIVRSRTGFESTEGDALDGAILASDSAASPFGQITVRGNTIIDGPGDIYVFGPLLPEVFKTFNPAKITSIVGTTVNGTSGDDSPCPNCIVDFYLDDDDPTQEALIYLGETTADASGNFTYELTQALSPGQTIRTASTTQSDNVIGTYDAGTTTKFSDPYGPDGMVITPVPPTPTATINTMTVEPVNTPTPTPTPTASPEPTPTSPPITIITVNTTSDPSPTDNKLTCNYTRNAFFFPGDDTGPTCSFRWAWNEAIGRPQEDRPIEIRFDIPTNDPNYELNETGTWVIELADVLPGLNPDNGANGTSLNGQVIIDGTTQPGGRERTVGPKIIIDTNDRSWEIESENNLIKNIAMRGGGVIFLKEDDNVVEDIWMGLSDDGQTISFREPGNPQRMAGGGVFISADNNIVRGNVISGAFAKAVDVNSGNVNNLIVDNYIGTRADGTLPPLDQSIQCQRDFSNVLEGNWYGGWGISLAGTGNKVINNVIAGLHILQSANDTPPMAIEIFGADHIIEGNSIGRDTSGADVGTCGQGIKFSDTGHQIIRNTVVRTRQGFENNLLNAILASDSEIGAFGQVTIRENTIIDSPEKIYEFGPGISDSLRFFEPAKITVISGTTVMGTSGTDSYCPGCLIDFYVDDLDEVQESFTFLGSTLADSMGNFKFEMANPLTDDTALRTATTSQQSNTIPGFGPGTTTKFSTLSIPIETINIEGPTDGIPGETYFYTVTVGPSYAGRPISMTVAIEDVAPSFVTFNEGESPVRLYEIKWQSDGIKTISVTAENNMARISGSIDMDLGGEDPTPDPSETSTPGPSETTTPGPSETTTPGPSETTTPNPSETSTPVPAVTPTPQSTNPPLSGGDEKIFIPITQG